jgi:sugar O-acyltransferase (sialic acid O-acetyltransferase NeuD family)
MRKLIILGAGGTAFDLIDIAHAMNMEQNIWEIIGFLDDNKDLIGKIIYGYPVLGMIQDSVNFADAYFVSSIANIYDPELRKRIIQDNNINIDRLASLVHPKAIISDSATIGNGVVIYANVTLSSRVVVGHNVFLCGNTFLGHECNIGNNCAISVGCYLASDVSVGDCTYLGVGVMARHQIKIGESCIIGLGTRVVKNVPDRTKHFNKMENFFESI